MFGHREAARHVPTAVAAMFAPPHSSRLSPFRSSIRLEKRKGFHRFYFAKNWENWFSRERYIFGESKN